MRKFFWLIPLMTFIGCINNRSKRDHKRTVNLCEYKPNGCACNLYVEVFNVYGMGALGSDVNSDYLTDSVNFRIYMGTYDDYDERITSECKGDSVDIEKTVATSSMPEWDFRKVLESRTYSLKDLKKQHEFE